MTNFGVISVFCPLVTGKSLEKTLLNQVLAGTKIINRQTRSIQVKAGRAFDLVKLPRAIGSDEEI